MDSWSKEDYSRHVREASKVVEKFPELNPPSGRVPGRGLLTLPISEEPRRRNDGEICDSRYDDRVFGRRGKYRPKEGTRGGGPHPGGLVARPGGGRRRVAAWASRGSPLAQLMPREAFVMLIFIYFLVIFGAV